MKLPVESIKEKVDRIATFASSGRGFGFSLFFFYCEMGVAVRGRHPTPKRQYRGITITIIGDEQTDQTKETEQKPNKPDQQGQAPTPEHTIVETTIVGTYSTFSTVTYYIIPTILHCSFL